MSNQPDVIVTKEETIADRRARQGIFHASISFYIASGFVLLWGLAAMAVVLDAYFHGKDAPTWAVALESSTITAALAIVFKDKIPAKSKRKTPRRQT